MDNVARVSLSGFYSIFNVVYDKPNSTLAPPSGTGGSTNSIDYFQFINADKFIVQGGTSSQFLKADGTVDSNDYLTVTQVSPITLVAANWTLVSGLYNYVYSNASILSTSIVDVIPANSTISIVKAADVLPATSSAVGTVTLFATNLPTSNITVTVNIYN